MILLIDLSQNISEATYVPMLIDKLKQSEYQFAIVRRKEDIPKKVKVSGVILSGSPLRIGEIDMNKVNIALYCHLKYPNVPTLGICFGCQLLNVIYGGKVKYLGQFYCGYANLSNNKKAWFCLNDVIDKVAIGFKTLAVAQIGKHRFPCHIQYQNITGVLFHPEYDDINECLGKYLRSTKKYTII